MRRPIVLTLSVLLLVFGVGSFSGLHQFTPERALLTGSTVTSAGAITVYTTNVDNYDALDFEIVSINPVADTDVQGLLFQFVDTAGAAIDGEKYDVATAGHCNGSILVNRVTTTSSLVTKAGVGIDETAGARMEASYRISSFDNLPMARGSIVFAEGAGNRRPCHIASGIIYKDNPTNDVGGVSVFFGTASDGPAADDIPDTIEGTTEDNPVRITMTAHAFVDNMEVYISGVDGDAGAVLNGNTYTATDANANYITIPVDGSAGGGIGTGTEGLTSLAIAGEAKLFGVFK